MSKLLPDPDQEAALRTYVDRLRSWGENDPDPDYFTGDALSCLLLDCGHASEAFAAVLARATAAEAERHDTIERFAGLVVEKAFQRIRAEAAEVNLIALAKMYGEACGRLHQLGFLMAENVVIEVVEDDEQGRELLAGIEAVTTARDAAEATLREKEAEIERLTSELRGWKGVAVIAAIPLEAMRMAGSYRALAPSTQTCVDEAVVTIRMAVSGHSLPPEGDVDAALAPARAALTQSATPASSDEATR